MDTLRYNYTMKGVPDGQKDDGQNKATRHRLAEGGHKHAKEDLQKQDARGSQDHVEGEEDVEEHPLLFGRVPDLERLAVAFQQPDLLRAQVGRGQQQACQQNPYPGKPAVHRKVSNAVRIHRGMQIASRDMQRDGRPATRSD